MRLSFNQRMQELRDYCWEVLHGRTPHAHEGKITVSTYAARIGVSKPHAHRLLKHAALVGVVEIDTMEGHNGIPKIIVDPATVDAAQIPF